MYSIKKNFFLFVNQYSHPNPLCKKYDIKEFSPENLYVNGLISQNDRVKILGNGEIKAKVAFKVNAVSGKAKAVIEAAGGTVEIVK